MDQRVKHALSLMRDALALLDECREYVAATHLQRAIDALNDRSAGAAETSPSSLR